MSVLRLVPMFLPRAKLAEPLPTTNGGVLRTHRNSSGRSRQRAHRMPRRKGGLHGLKANPSARADDQHSRHCVDAPGRTRSLTVMCDAGSHIARLQMLSYEIWNAQTRDLIQGSRTLCSRSIQRGTNRTLRDSISVPQLVFLPRAEIAGNAAIFSPR